MTHPIDSSPCAPSLTSRSPTPQQFLENPPKRKGHPILSINSRSGNPLSIEGQKLMMILLMVNRRLRNITAYLKFPTLQETRKNCLFPWIKY